MIQKKAIFCYLLVYKSQSEKYLPGTYYIMDTLKYNTIPHDINKGKESGFARPYTLEESSFFFLFDNHCYFPDHLAGGFTISDLLDKPLSQVSSLLPPGTWLHFLLRIGFRIPTARQSLSKVANSRSRAFR